MASRDDEKRLVFAADRQPTVFCHFTTAHRTLKSRSFHRQCAPLAAAGFRVRYVSPAEMEGTHEGVEFVRLSEHAGAFEGPAGHMRLLRTLLQQNANIYHFQDPQLLPIGLLLKKVFHRRVIYDAYEDFPSMMGNKASLPRGLRATAAAGISAIESCAARWLDAIITADPLTIRRFAGSPTSRKLVFYNFPNLDYFPRAQSREKRFDLVYRGGLSDRAGTFLLLEALRRLADQGRFARLLLIGYTDSQAEERRLHEQISLLARNSYVEIRGRIPHEEMAAALSEARIGISPLMDIPKFRLNIPVKIFEYWASSLAVVASDLPPSRPFVRNSSAAVVFPPGDADGLTKAIVNLLDHPDLAQKMGELGRKLVESRFNNNSEARRFELLCRTLTGESRVVCAREFQHA
ncbi:MAG TPA: glycosyltransferase [Candidatus Aquilonibacter sp.]|nr:glycosyltransferase [Candidatus Aquilonibacter sp.]